MTSKLISPSRKLGYTDIYLDFLAGNDPARSFYNNGAESSVAEHLDRISFDREKLVDILRKQNALYEASTPAMDAIEQLRDPRAVCVFSGQQAGLIGGPLLTLVKAIGCVKTARSCSELLGRPVIPMFWIAGDDHDFEEANHTFVLDRRGELVRLAYQAPPEFEVPMSETAFVDSEELDRIKSRCREALGDTDFTPELYDLIDGAYTPKDTFTSAFGKLMAGLTRDYGLVFFSPGDDAAKSHAAPFFRSIVEKQDDLQRSIADRNHLIEQSNYHIQVEKKDNAVHLFYNYKGRRPILRNADHFEIDEQHLDREELLNLIDRHPERFSPDVMTRPILQSYLFPTVLQRGGPAEIAYLAQINPVFDLFGLPVPVHRARPTITLLEKRFEKLMQDETIDFEELTGDVEKIVNKVLARSFPTNLEDLFGHLRRHVECHFEDISRGSLEFDPALKGFAKQTFSKIDFALNSFEGKVFSSHKKKQQEARDRIYRLWHAVYPNRGLQERSLNITYFISKYGFGVVDFLYEMMNHEEKSHQVLALSELRK